MSGRRCDRTLEERGSLPLPGESRARQGGALGSWERREAPVPEGPGRAGARAQRARVGDPIVWPGLARFSLARTEDEPWFGHGRNFRTGGEFVLETTSELPVYLA